MLQRELAGYRKDEWHFPFAAISGLSWGLTLLFPILGENMGLEIGKAPHLSPGKEKASSGWLRPQMQVKPFTVTSRSGKSNKVSSGVPTQVSTPGGWQRRHQALPLARQDEGIHLHSGFPQPLQNRN